MSDHNREILALLLDEDLSIEGLKERLKAHISERMQHHHPQAWSYYTGEGQSEENYYKLASAAMACMRLLDYADHEGEEFPDQNLHGEVVSSRPLALLRSALRGEVCEASPDFIDDMAHLMAQLSATESKPIPTRGQVLAWMERHPSGLDSSVMAWREENKERIIGLLVTRIEAEGRDTGRYTFREGMDGEEKRAQVRLWWDDDRFHLHYAIRDSEALDAYLDHSLTAEELSIMRRAEEKGIPIFATPYFLTLIDTRPLDEQERPRSDAAIRSYLLYSQDLVDEFGRIVAWEKEDIAEPGEPNAAGWVLPSHNVHRRYPNVAIFIPDTMGRACGGLCAYCQRMYDFQAGRFNFELETLKPKRSWPELLKLNMEYFRNDPYLSDILITGGDAFMSSPRSLSQILDAVLEMAAAKRADNEGREERYEEMRRVRLGTKIPVYLPQRINSELVEVLRSFKERSGAVGIEECIVQTHISTAMEITRETRDAIARLLAAGWAVTNQEVFTVAASRRGHSAALRKALNDIGVLPYYNFSVKGFRENRELFATNARSTQEQVEEASIGQIAQRYHAALRSFLSEAERMVEKTDMIRKGDEIPFISPDRNTINLPGVGKSNTYRTIGITADGRRILRFEFDHSRAHSPVIEEMGHVIIIESKSIAAYLRQLEAMGEDVSEYETIWEYSAGSLEPRSAIFEGAVL